jgi:ribosomal protein S14
MRPADTAKRLHPGLGTLALYSSGDLPWRSRWRIGRHVARCADCERQVTIFRSCRAELRREAEAQTLTGFEAIADWNRLEREMLGNIGVGVAAARCIDKVRRGPMLLARVGLIGGLAALFVAGWVTHIPKEQTEHVATALRRVVGLERPPVTGTILRATPDAIAVRAHGATLTIMHPPSAVVSVSGNSAVSARYVDEETGQVTITKVYAQ